MKALFLLVLVGLCVAFPLTAQEQTCAIDLSGIQDVLTQAASAEPLEAIALMAQARAELLRIEQTCAAAGVVLLDQTYTSPNSTFSLSYPHGWTTGAFTESANGGVVFIGNSPFADRLLQVEQPVIKFGEQAVQVLVGKPDDGLLATIVADFETLIKSLYTDVSTTEYYTVDERAAARLSYRGEGFDGVVVGVELGDGRFVVVRGVAASGDLGAISAAAEAIALSVQ